MCGCVEYIHYTSSNRRAIYILLIANAAPTKETYTSGSISSPNTVDKVLILVMLVIEYTMLALYKG